MKRVRAATVVLAIAVCIEVGWDMKSSRDAAKKTKSDYQAVSKTLSEYGQPEKPAPSIVTQAKYDQIREGMTYEDVSQIIGTSGKEISRADSSGSTTVVYYWLNADNSSMNATFRDGRLTGKTQFGLP